jgi:hypothetical protein
VFDGYDSDQVLLVVEAVDDAIISAACAVKALEAQLQWFADAMRAGRQGAVEELHHGGRYFLGQPDQCPA